MPVTVYKITSPSNKSYIGITSTSFSKRWAAHKNYAKKKSKPHPFYDAINYYGAECFTFEILVENLSLEDAKEQETHYIALFNTTDRSCGYNITRGGDHQGADCGKAAWAAINSSVESRSSYLSKLSKRKLANDWSDYAAMVSASLKWREDNPELAREIDQNGVAAMRKWASENLEKVKSQGQKNIAKARKHIESNPEYHRQRLSAGIKESFQKPERLAAHAEQVTEVWAKRTPEQRQRIGNAIAKGKKAYHKSAPAEVKQAIENQLAQARKNIDHDLRKKNQKAALAVYWTPERKAAKAAEYRKRYAENGSLAKK